MWLFTKYGFFSVVKKKFNKEDMPFQIRSRRRADLQNVVSRVNLPGPIIETSDSDYPYRIVVDEADLGRLFSVLVQELDYSNFKDAIKGIDDQKDKLTAYHEVWRTMLDYQQTVSG